LRLLELAEVSKSYASGRHGSPVLDRVSLEVADGEVVAVWGRRRSGRSTLLRVAAGVEPPDTGAVRFRGEEVHSGNDVILRQGIAYCRKSFPPGEGQLVFDHLLSSQEAFGVSGAVAKAQAREALRRVVADRCGASRPEHLDAGERVRVAIARVLTLQPMMLVIDDPTMGIDLCERDAILDLLRSLAESGTAVLMSTGETPCLSIADRVLTIGGGALRGQLTPKLAQVVTLHREAQPAA
jgi:putative ABC transport system ATP-binding protein